jgi:hypothetical protein
MSACIPNGKQISGSRLSGLNVHALRNAWPVAAAIAAMVCTVYFGANNRKGEGLIRLAAAPLAQSVEIPRIRASQFRVEREQGYVTVTGMASSLTQIPFKHVEALVEFFDNDGGLIKADSALIDLPVLRGGEESPFTVQTRDAPRMKSYRIRFRELLGPSIPSTDR